MITKINGIRLTSKFGEISEIRNFRPHKGIDLAVKEGTELNSIISGVVERITPENTPLGNGIIIRGDDGRAYVYGHLKEVHVTPGQRVEFGDFIGLSGNSGTSTTGPHLHFAVQEPSGEFIDPEPLADALADLTGKHTPGTLEKVKMFFNNGQIDQYDQGENVVLDYLSNKAAVGLTTFWDWFITVLPDIAGYSTILAGIVIIIGAMVGRGGALKALAGYGAFLILAVCILAYQ